MDVTKLRFTRYICICVAYNEILLSQGGNPDLNHVTKDETRSVVLPNHRYDFKKWVLPLTNEQYILHSL
jgi:hypothetical protein